MSVLWRREGFKILYSYFNIDFEINENKNRPYLQYLTADRDFVDLCVTFL